MSCAAGRAPNGRGHVHDDEGRLLLDRKRCTLCGEVKPVGAFTPHARGFLGRGPECRRCRSAAKSALYRTSERERQRVLAVMRRYQARKRARLTRAA